MFPIACYGRGSALLYFLYFLPPCSSCLSPGRTHTPALQTGKTGAQGIAMTHSLAQNGSLEDLHFPAPNAQGRFCPDKNDSGSISWEFTAGQGKQPAHPKCYWGLETHLRNQQHSSGTVQNIFSFLWIKIWTGMSKKQVTVLVLADFLKVPHMVILQNIFRSGLHCNKIFGADLWCPVFSLTALLHAPSLRLQFNLNAGLLQSLLDRGKNLALLLYFN